MSNFGIKFRSLDVRHIATDVIQNLAVAQGALVGVIQNLSQYFCTKSVVVAVYANSRVALDLQSVQLQALGKGISWGPAEL